MARVATIQQGKAENAAVVFSDAGGPLSTTPFVRRISPKWTAKPTGLFLTGVTCFGLAAVATEVVAATNNAPGKSVTVEHLQSQPVAVLPERMADVAAELEGYRELTDGWDGSESKAPSPQAIDDAVAFVAALPPESIEPAAMISADGQVGLYWDHNGDVASISFFGLGRLSYYADIQGTVARGNLTGARGMVPGDLLALITHA